MDLLVWFYNQRTGAENHSKEANNDAGLAAHPSNRWVMNANWFQIAMLAYNLDCWLQLFQRDENATVETIKYATLATARLRFLFLAARIWRHAGAWAPALAIITRRKTPSSGSWSDCAKSLADRMDLLPCLARLI